MAVNVTGKKPMFGNRRSHALNATRHQQKLNLQVVTLEDGTLFNSPSILPSLI